MQDNPICISAPEAATMVGIGKSKFWNMVKAGEIPVVRLGHRTLVPVDGLRKFIETRTSGGISKAVIPTR